MEWNAMETTFFGVYPSFITIMKISIIQMKGIVIDNCLMGRLFIRLQCIQEKMKGNEKRCPYCFSVAMVTSPLKKVCYPSLKARMLLLFVLKK